MVAFTALVSAISMALLATTASAVPTVLTSRQWPPPTSTVLDFTLYKTTQPGNEGQCWDGAIGAHVAPSDIGACNKADFYTFQINTVHPGYDCQVNVFSDDSCSSKVGSYLTDPSFSPCKFPSGPNFLIDLMSWSVTCN